ncbi:MAG: 30S ribosomal protein S20 [Candidatus Omnitrophica bacterium]|nr:30S ribosomal protein S20 [Candidatus Omnitrophota bacterium]
MPQRRSGIQELRLTKKKHLHNLDVKTDLKKTIKRFRTAVESKNVSEAKALLSTVFKKIDKSVKRNLIQENTAARRKSQFSKLLKSTT